MLIRPRQEAMQSCIKDKKSFSKKAGVSIETIELALQGKAIDINDHVAIVKAIGIKHNGRLNFTALTLDEDLGKLTSLNL